MAERRPLVAGVNKEEIERKFVHGEKGETLKSPNSPTVEEAPKRQAKKQDTVARVPLTTRVRADYAAALKRASLERQLNNEIPNTLQDILEEALGPWLQKHGYVK